METIFKGEQVNQISSHLNIPKNTVYSVITEYVSYLREKLESGKTVKVLNICYLKVEGKSEEAQETLAYICSEIGEKIGISQPVVYRVLTSLEDFIIKDLRKLNPCTIRGLVRIRLEKNYKGEYKVRTKKSVAYNNWDIYVTTLPSFKRRAEVLG